MFWTEERDALLLERIKANFTAGEVAKEFGTTRNAVLGRAYRVGYRFGQKGFWATNLLNRLRELYEAQTPRAQIAAEFDTTEKAVSDALRKLHRTGLDYRERPNRRNGNWRRGPRQAPRRPPPPPNIDFGAVTFRELTDWHCKYIAGKPAGADTRYCGAEAMRDLPYCAEHWELCHAKATVHAD